MKKVLCILLAITLVSSFPYVAQADTTNDANSLNEIYTNAYTQAIATDTDIITDDISAYAFILHNRTAINIINNQLVLNTSYVNSSQLVIIQDFISRLNVLLEKGAIEIDADFKISTKPAPSIQSSCPRAPTFNLMDVARANAEDLKEVFDNAAFGTAHAVAGLYFVDRVRSGGAWDFKSKLGTTRSYYIPELKVYMKGETIGNFHYGYVGSAVFTPFELKSAAGLYQIWSGTSDLSFWDSYFDDPADTEDIQWGIDVYNDEH